MQKLNLKKRAQLLSAFNCSPSSFCQRTEFVENIIGLLQRRELVGLKGFFNTGKTTVMYAVMRSWGSHEWKRLHSHTVDRFDTAASLQKKEAKFRGQQIALMDECCRVYAGRNGIARKAFVDLVQRLHADGIPVLIVYPKCPGDIELEADLPDMNTVILPPALSLEETMEAITQPFEDTGVELSGPTKARIIELSEGHPSIFIPICSYLIFEISDKIRNSTESIVIEADPQLTLDEFLYGDRNTFPLALLDAHNGLSSLNLGLTTKEKALLVRLVEGADTEGYEPEIDELKKWGLIGKELEIGLVIRTFVDINNGS